MCLLPDAFAAFIGYLDSSLLEGVLAGMIRIHATDGPVDWIWMAKDGLWCIDGVLVTPGVGR